MRNYQKNTLALLSGSLLTIVALYSFAIIFAPTPTNAELIPACSASGACGVCDIIGVFITLGKWLVTGAAGLALVVIVWAGVSLATSAGNPEKVGGAKKQILGAIIGLGAVLMAFQFVSMIIFLVVTPSDLQTFEAGQTGTEQNKEQGARASLTSFLGIPWWQICSQDELIAKGGKATGASTASCLYWGNDTTCGNNMICCRGECKPGQAAHKDASGKEVPSDCPLYIQVSASRPDLAQEPGQGGRGGSTGSPPVCNQPNSAQEQAVRTDLGSANITINNSRECGNADYSAYIDQCKDHCTSVGGLTANTISSVKKIAQKCGAIQINGGSELGHTVGGAHEQGLAVDFKTTAALGNCLTANIAEFGISKICVTGDNEEFSRNCGTFRETAEHIHVQF